MQGRDVQFPQVFDIPEYSLPQSNKSDGIGFDPTGIVNNIV